MENFLKGVNDEFSSDRFFAVQDIQQCPFLRNINEATSFSFSSPMNFLTSIRGAKGPIFEDGPNFNLAFRLFHGCDGAVPLSGRSFPSSEISEPPYPTPQFNPLAAKAATISLSAFGPGGPFSFDAFNDKWKKQEKKPCKKEPSKQADSHEAMGNEWLETGNCPISKSYRAVNRVLPLVAKALQPPPGMKLKCPPAVVAARAALARTALVKTLRPQPLPAKMLVIGVLGMAANVPLGIWREHTEKFSASWFVAIHSAIPFIAMLRKSVLMPKSAMAFTIAASVLGQVIGSRAERIRLKRKALSSEMMGKVESKDVNVETKEKMVGLGGLKRGEMMTLVGGYNRDIEKEGITKVGTEQKRMEAMGRATLTGVSLEQVGRDDGFVGHAIEVGREGGDGLRNVAVCF
ncbi:uncharacterized protein LOC18423922 [Amborella trichopoda]|uniref:uncharacterized protein LOC18423922 n=1 Tax=Amborella trichopoda TaxID=13333 RepID=UPI0005D43336|nr:uncharacterized protein LOC18423922 [Amborella trichopoda]|eukprot:XP_011628457.1 uncharacterized protein LOC18423922 [Amborella trichopoda]